MTPSKCNPHHNDREYVLRSCLHLSHACFMLMALLRLKDKSDQINLTCIKISHDLWSQQRLLAAALSKHTLKGSHNGTESRFSELKLYSLK